MNVFEAAQAAGREGGPLASAFM